MRLMIGGAGQGKLAWTLAELGLTAQDAADSFEAAGEKPVFNGLHLAVRRAMDAGLDPAAEMEHVLAKNPDVAVICDEIGCGVVPLDPANRDWREATGRLLCALAQRADRVERIFCGLSMKLK